MQIQFNLSDQQKRLSEYTDITVRVCCCWHFLYYQDCLCPICLEYFSFVAENANGFALLVIKMKPSHLMCDRVTHANCVTHSHMPYEQGSIVYGAEFIAASQKYQQKVTHVLTRIGTPIHTQACKNLFVIMAAYISCSHTQGCQTKFSTDTTEFSFRLKQTNTDTNKHTLSSSGIREYLLQCNMPV